MNTMFKKTDVKLETCDLGLATTFSQMPALEGERRLKPARLNFLRNHVKAGTFTDPSWTVVIDKITGMRYRANGQHSSTVLAELSADDWAVFFPNGLMVTIEEYTTDNITSDAFLIFDIFDNPASARANVDVINLHRVHYPDLKDVDSQVLLNLLAGVAMDQKGLGEKGRFLPPRQRGLYLDNDENRQFAIWAAPFATTKHGWMLKKAGVVAEMVVDRRIDAEKADEFWQLVFNENHSDPDHATRELSRTLKDWASKPKVSQNRFQKEAAKRWKQFRPVSRSMPQIEINYGDRPIGDQPQASL